MPPSQEERTVGRWGIQPQFITEYNRDLFRVWTANHSSVRAPGRPSGILPDLLPEPEDQCWRRQPARLWQRPIGGRGCGRRDEAAFRDFWDVAVSRTIRYIRPFSTSPPQRSAKAGLIETPARNACWYRSRNLELYILNRGALREKRSATRQIFSQIASSGN
jgi:hypothetical protein